jgi:hypothetical protein
LVTAELDSVAIAVPITIAIAVAVAAPISIEIAVEISVAGSVVQIVGEAECFSISLCENLNLPRCSCAYPTVEGIKKTVPIGHFTELQVNS